MFVQPKQFLYIFVMRLDLATVKTEGPVEKHFKGTS